MFRTRLPDPPNGGTPARPPRRRPTPAAGGIAAAAAVAAALAALALTPFTPWSGAAAQNGGAGRPRIDMNAWRDAPEAGGVVDLQRLSGPIALDGFSDEAAWQTVEPLRLVMYEPEFRGRTDRTIQVLLAYDDEAIYVAGRFYHDDPSDIRAFSLTRDQWKGDDGFGLFLDTFNDNENGVRFIALPLGARMDMSVSGDGRREIGASTGPSGLSWNAHWELRTRMTDEGWFGEMRIPFTSLRFESDADGNVVMGLMAYAYEPGRETRWTFPAIPRSALYSQVSVWQDVRLRGIESRNPVYFSPYVLADSRSAAQLNGAGTGYERPAVRGREVGGDLKINPTPNLTLDLTLNTDFAAVEADQQQVNLTRFSLFFDEKRPFFQERAGIFSFATGADRGTLFYSRRIGLADGRPVPILGGARLVGRIGTWDVGLIGMQTEASGGLPTENFGVLRLRRRVLNDNSFVGGMATSRVDGEGRYNVTYGLDGQLRLWGDEYLTLKWLQTVQGGDASRDAAPTGIDAARLVVDWTRRRFQGLSYQNVFVWSGAGYDPAMGFESRRDFTRAQSDWNYQWFPGLESPWRRVWLGVQSNVWVRHDDDRVDTGQLSPFLALETNTGLTLRWSTNTQYENVPEAFALSDAAGVPAGRYWATEAAFRLEAPRGWMIRPNTTFTAGQFFDGTRVAIDNDFDWPVNPYLQLRGGWQWNRIRFPDRGQAFDANLLRLTVRAAADTHLSLDLFAQYNSTTEQVTTNARLRYNFREGQDLWLVWNEGLNLERDVVGRPRLPRTDARTLAVKYTHTFIF